MNPQVPRVVPPVVAADVLEARIRLNESRLAGMALGIVVTVLAIVVGSALPAISLVAGVALIGAPVGALIGGVIAASSRKR